MISAELKQELHLLEGQAKALNDDINYKMALISDINWPAERDHAIKFRLRQATNKWNILEKILGVVYSDIMKAAHE